MKSFLKHLTSPALSFILLCLPLMQPACSIPEKNTPEGVTQSFYTAFRAKNFSKAKKYATAASAPLIDILGGMAENAENPLANNAKADFSLKTLSESTSTATVQVVLPDNTKAIVLQLEKENGMWKVAFDKSLD